MKSAHYDRDRALAEALAASVGHGAGEVDVTVTNPGLGEGYTGGQMIASVRLPDWAARSWCVQLGAPRLEGGDANVAGTIVTPLGFPSVPNMNPGIIPLIGRLVWGVGGASFQADVSWFQGNAIHVHGSYVELRAVAFANPPWTGLAAGARVKVAGAIIPAESAGRQAAPPMLQSAPVLINNGTTTTFLVPDYATAATLVRHAGPNAWPTCEIAFYRDPALANNVFFEVLAAGAANMMATRAAERMFQIPGNARFMTVRNIGGFNETFHVEWQLNLG